MPSLLERYGTLFEKCLTGGRLERFFLDPKLLPGPKSELRRQLRARISEKPLDERQLAAPIVLFLAHFIDDYSRYEQDVPGIFRDLNLWMTQGLIMDRLLDPKTLMDQRVSAITAGFNMIMANYMSAKELLIHDLRELGVRGV
jgi:hypothetical protein